MNDFENLRCASLAWRQNKDKSGHDLLRGQKLAGTLISTIPNTGAAIAECAEGAWRLHWSGIFADKVKILDTKENQVTSLTFPYLTGGKCSFADGTKYHVAEVGILRNTWQIANDLKEVVITFKPTPLPLKGLFSVEADVDITPAGRQLDHLPVLMFATWYAIISVGVRSAG